MRKNLAIQAMRAEAGGKGTGTFPGETIENKIRELRRLMNYDSETEDAKECEIIINKKGKKGKGKNKGKSHMETAPKGGK